jgi:outer membrane protein assembly factor BamB
MKRYFVILTLLAGLAIGFDSRSARSENWPAWRGPRADGISREENVPTDWDVKNAAWKTELPGKGHASPIVWGDRIVTVTALPDQKDRIVLCVDRNNGKILWQKTVVNGPLEKIHDENSYASGTPSTDGERVFVVFRVGDEIVVAAHNLADGKQIWLKQPGKHVGEWGFSNTPVLYKDKVIIDGDSKGDSFLIALSRDDGHTLWRVDRTHKGISYSAPLIREMAGRMQLVQCGDRRVTGFDPDSGKELWTVDGPSQEFVASPFYDAKTNLVFVSSSWPERHILAIRPDGSGNVTDTNIMWRDKKGAPYIVSFVVVDDLFFSISSDGTLYCYDAATGKNYWHEKVRRHHASPVLVGGLIYCINDDGQINVIKPAKTFQRVAQFDMGEQCYASPAISDGQVFLRGFEHLYCIGKSRHAEQ